jgi:PAS domain S-box-containing protein
MKNSDPAFSSECPTWIFEGSPLLFAELDQDGAILQANSSWTKTLGWRPEALKGRRISELVHPDDLAHSCLFGPCDTVKVCERPFRLRSPSGAWFWLCGYATPSPTGTLALVLRDCSEDERRRSGSEKSAERLRVALNAANAGVIEIDFQKKTVWCSESVIRLLGQELKFNGPEEVPWPMCHPDDRVKFLDATWEGARHRPIELRVIHPSGDIHWIELTGEREFDEAGHPIKITALVSDIDDRKRQELALNEARLEAQAIAKRLKIALQAASAGVFETDLERRTFWCSPEFTEIIGRQLTFEEACGIWPHIHPDDVALVQSAVDSSQQARGDAHAEWRVRLPSGEWRWIEVYGLPTYGDSAVPLRLTGVAVDIDERKRQQLALVEAQTSAQSAAEAKAEFLANISHEIRTPMNGVLGVLHLLAQEPLSEGGRRLLTEAETCGRMLSELLNDVIDFSKVDAGRLELAPEPLDPAQVLESVVELMRPQAEAKRLQLGVEVEGDRDWILADPVRLRQVLFNLIGNAVKFTVEGGVKVRLRISGVGRGGRRIRFEVTDTGVGIPEAAQAGLFGRFIQADGSTARRFGGSGLGLAITKRLAELMGGDVGFVSEEGRGSTFWFEAPVPLARQPAAPDPNSAGDLGLDGVRILLVEDNPTNRLVGTKILEALGAKVETADDGTAGVCAVRRGDYDLVLMDIQMPGMDGLEATRRIRALPGAASATPIIAMTANALSHQKDTYLAIGMDGLVAKPISPAQLTAEIVRVLRGDAAPSEKAQSKRRRAARG